MKKILIFTIFLILLTCCSHSPGTQITEKIIPFTLKGNQHSIQGEIHDVQDSDTVILFLLGGIDQGRKSDIIWIPLFEGLKRKNISVAIYDQRCFGLKSENLDKIQSCSFNQMSQDAQLVYSYLKSLSRYRQIILIGHAEGSIMASEISFKNANDDFLKKLILFGGFFQSYGEILHQQMTTTMARNIFIEIDLNKDGRISKEEIPENLSHSLPLEKLDPNNRGYFTQGDLLRLSEKQYIQFSNLVTEKPNSTYILGKPAIWYKELFSRKSLIDQAVSFTTPVTIIHGKLDQTSPFNSNALTLNNKLHSLKKRSNLVAIPNVGHYFSEMKENLATHGPIQQETLQIILNAI